MLGKDKLKLIGSTWRQTCQSDNLRIYLYFFFFIIIRKIYIVEVLTFSVEIAAYDHS